MSVERTTRAAEGIAGPIALPSAFDTSVVRLLAALFIINSHGESLYPRSWLADGGQLGLAIFFIVAGMGTAMSGKTKRWPFAPWYAFRLLRLYPSIWITKLVFVVALDRAFVDWTWRDYLTQFVYPIDGYTFFVEIIPFYAMGYGLVRWSTRRGIETVIAATGVAALLTAVPNVIGYARVGGALHLGGLWLPFQWSVLFLGYAIGIWIGTARPAGLVVARLQIAVLFGLSAAYLIVKFSLVAVGVAAAAFPILWAIVIAWALVAIDIGRSPWFRGAIGRVPRLATAITVAGGWSLEMFLVHLQFIERPLVKSRPFPLNLLVLLALTLIVSGAFAWFARMIRRALEALIERGLRLGRGERAATGD